MNKKIISDFTDIKNKITLTPSFAMSLNRDIFITSIKSASKRQTIFASHEHQITL